MRIVFTSYVYSPGFSDPLLWLRRIAGYIGILEALSMYHEVISIEQINYEGTFNQNGVDYRFLKVNNKFLPARLHNYIKDLRPDVVFVHGMHFPLQVIQLSNKLPKNVKLFVQNHAERPAAGLKRLLQRFVDRKIDGYFFTSLEMGESWMNQKIIRSREKIHEVMEASSVFRPFNKFQAREKTGVKGNPAFLWVGRLDANKDPITVVKAFIQFLSHQPQACLYMIFHTEEMKDAIMRVIEPCKENICLVGNLPHEELQWWFNSADFIISGSHYEGSGVAVCEGMSCGCIPLVTNIASFRMMTAGGSCGKLYVPGDVEALLRVLQQTMEMNLEKEREKVLRQFESSLSFNAIAGKINHVLTSS